MSYTEIYAFNKKGNAYMADLAHNAWRGGMAVWNIMEERHLPLYIPEYIKKCNWYHPGMSEEEIITRNGFRPRRTAPTLSGKKEGNPTREIWALADDLEIPCMSASSCSPHSMTAWSKKRTSRVSLRRSGLLREMTTRGKPTLGYRRIFSKRSMTIRIPSLSGGIRQA